MTHNVPANNILARATKTGKYDSQFPGTVLGG